MINNYLFSKYVCDLEKIGIDDKFKVYSSMILKNAKEMVECEDRKYYNYYPQEKRDIQLVLETTKKKNEDNDECYINAESFFFHHTSGCVWRVKIIEKLSSEEDTYIVSPENGKEGVAIIRLVNSKVLGEIKEDDVIDVQVSAFAITGNVYKNNEEYKASIKKSEDGAKHIVGEGALIPVDFLLNYDADIPENERQDIDHTRDILILTKGTITTCAKYSLRMFDVDCNSYYSANINTVFGELKILFTRTELGSDLKGFGEGYIFAGQIFISGDVCIYDYDKYIKPSDIVAEPIK